MKRILFFLAPVILVLFTIVPAIAEDCETINENKVCWEDSSSTTFSWTTPRMTIGAYQIEVRDFNWLGSLSINVSKGGIVKEGVLSEGEANYFDFSNDSDFEGIRIIADEVSNINTFPAKIGTFPADPRAKISFKLSTIEEKDKPTLELDITSETKADDDPKITVTINTKNTGDADLVDAQVRIIHDGLVVLKELDYESGSMNEVTSSGYDIKWEDLSSYKLTAENPGIIKNGYFINVLNFSNKNALINISYNASIKNYALTEGGYIVFNSTHENNYAGIKIIGTHLSNDSAELVLQSPKRNSLKKVYPTILADGSESLILRFQILPSSRKSFAISVIASAKDRDGKNYSKSVSKTISQNTFKIKKITSNSMLGEKLYPEFSIVGGIASIKNITYVTILVDNNANYPLYGVSLKDAILPGFNFVDDSNLTTISWDFDINARGHKEFTYAITAKRQGVYNLPKAWLTWNEFGETFLLESNAPKTTVSGPYIVMERSFNKSNINIGDTLMVSLSMTNNGDIPTNFMVNDSVPRNTTFLSGTLSFSGFLRPTEDVRIDYAIIVNDTVIEFKPPEMSSKNQGFEWYETLRPSKISGFSPISQVIPTNAPEMEVNVQQTPQRIGIIQMVNEKFPWLEGAISIITLIFGILIILMLNRTKYFQS